MRYLINSPRKCAIYFHRDVDTNEIIYIGVASEVRGQKSLSAKYPRAFDKSHAGRKKDHAEYCKEHTVVSSIEYEFDGMYSKPEAHEKERELISVIRPRFDRTFKGD